MKTPTTDRDRRSHRRSQGAALLLVLWLAAALSAIAFTLANTVRGEIERSSTDADGLKAYYLAEGAIDRTVGLHRIGPRNWLVPMENLASKRGKPTFSSSIIQPAWSGPNTFQRTRS